MFVSWFPYIREAKGTSAMLRACLIASLKRFW
jgi:hypothetical protein